MSHDISFVDTFRTAVGLLAAFLVLTGTAVSSFSAVSSGAPGAKVGSIVGSSVGADRPESSGLRPASGVSFALADASGTGPRARPVGPRSSRSPQALAASRDLGATSVVRLSLERATLAYARRDALLRSGLAAHGSTAPPYVG